MYSALDVAKYIVTKCFAEGEAISNLQLQKILYFLQYSALKSGNPLFDEDFEAWQFGPVIPVVYNRFSIYGGRSIRRSFGDVLLKIRLTNKLNSIIEDKRTLFPWDLVDATHKEGGAWKKAYDTNPKTRISKEAIINDNTIEV